MLRPARRSSVVLAALVLGVTAAVPAPTATASTADPPRLAAAPLQRGHEGLCTTSAGVSVVIDSQDLGGATLRRCAMPLPGRTAFVGTGVDALTAVRADAVGVSRWGMGFVCRINNTPSASQTLTVGGRPYQERCVDTPPAAAYWGYWHADDRSGGPWTYSTSGAQRRQAVNGGFEGWSFSHNRTAGDNPAPRVPAAAPRGTASPFSARTPTVSGTRTTGATVQATVGTWSPAPTTLSYRWYRDGVPIAGAWARTYRLTAADEGRQVFVAVQGAGTGRATTWATSAAFTPSSPRAFTTTAQPRVVGTPTPGRTLTAYRGTWSPAPRTTTWRWLRGGRPITGATSSTYRLTSADKGKRVSVKVTGQRPGYVTTTRFSPARTIR